MSGDLARLRAGTCGWVRRNACFLDSPPGRAELPVVPRAKAFLQLAGLARCWDRVRSGDPDLAEVGALVRRVWPRDELPDALAANPRYASQFSLMYCALAPTAVERSRAVLARLTADGYLSAVAASPYLRLEVAYYADMAGVAHGNGSYRELYAASLLAARTEALPITDADACTVAHTIFYLSDYGLRAPDLDRSDLDRARHIVVDLTSHCIERGEWDNVAKFVLSQFCLGLDPARTPSGTAGIRVLAGVLAESGAIPAKAIGLMPAPAATPTERFRKAYQVTLMTAIMALMVSSARM
ncbi:DUF6895 family protein [Lentzea sp.]|uniref:DUF6895 family protein n=1 Tax=Lentzea sp. TaxID=56099 RepID=UPI002BE7D811|nr:hypothetical protein [Lentzea sp.]HUQ59584.1 hypothetical protein [Lentzea sp.]